MSTTENTSLVLRYFDELVNGGNLAVAEELLAADYTHHDPALPPEMQRGRDNYLRGYAMFPAAFPDLHTAVEDVIAKGDKVVVRWTTRGTHQGSLMGIPPTGRQVTMTAIHILRLADGKIAEGWVNFDALGMLQQLGAIPAMA
jgi:steroid delta-isomerase-like uncharacterized protein